MITGQQLYAWEDMANPLKARDYKDPAIVAYAANGSAGGSDCYGIDAAIMSGGNCTAQGPCHYKNIQATLKAAAPHGVCYPIDSHQQDSRFKVCADGISPTLPGQMGTGGNNGPMVMEAAKPPRKYIIRRLTPKECERLQGFPDEWTQVPYKNKPMSDSARYKMCGNSVAIPCVVRVLGGLADAQNPR